MSSNAMTDREHQAALVRESLASMASDRVRMLVRHGRTAEAVKAVEDIARQHHDLMESLFTDPATMPIEFCGLPRRLTEVLQNHEYRTIGELRDDWPGKVLAKSNIEVYGHYLVGRMLAKFSLLDGFSPGDYA